MRLYPVIISLLISLTVSSCSCKGSGSSSKGGSDVASWAEIALEGSSLPPVQINVASGSESWVFANVLRSGEAWITSETPLDSAAAKKLASSMQMREDGWPVALPSGCSMWLGGAGYPTGNEVNSSGETVATYLHGVWVLTWEGSGTVELESSINDGTDVKTLVNENGRIVMLLTSKYKYPIAFVRSSSASDPVRNVKLWAPKSDGAGLTLSGASELARGKVDGSLEPLPGAVEPIFHPVFVAHLKEAGTGIPLRMMGFQRINLGIEDVPDHEFSWSDCGNAAYSFGSLSVIDSSYNRILVAGYKQEVGVPYEWLIDMCNQTGNDLWIQVPHLANEDLIRNLARLIAGRKGHAGLNKNLRVWFEFSNEIWNGFGPYLPQFNLARKTAAAHFGVSEANLTTEQEGWGSGNIQGKALAIFENEWALCGQTDDRLINVVSGFALSMGYNKAEIDAVKEINANLPEVVAISNYFGADSSSEIFSFYNWASKTDGNYSVWPDSLISQTRSSLRRSLYNTYEAWAANGKMAKEEGVHLVSYEGGQHILFVGLGDSADPTFAKFMKYVFWFEQSDYMKQLYTEHYALWSTAGGRAVSLFVDISSPSYWGCWGAKDKISDTRQTAKKWDAFLSWNESMNGVRALNNPKLSAPALADTLIKAEAGIAVSKTLTASGGDGAVSVEMVGGELPSGLTFTGGSNGSAVISGTPAASGTAKIILRALDADKDPAFKVYTISIDPEGMSAHSILCFDGNDITCSTNPDGTLNGRYDPQRDYEYPTAAKDVLCIPFMIDDGSALFGPEYVDTTHPGTGTIPSTSPLNMYGGWAVTQLAGSGVPNCESSYTVLRDNKFSAWCGANYNGTGAATTFDAFLVWKKDQFTSNASSIVYSFGSTSSTSALRVDFSELIGDGTNELRFAVLAHEGSVDQWYISEKAYTETYVGDGYLELTGFNGSSETGKRWAAINPSKYSFAIPAASSLSFSAKSFSDIRAVGIVYHGKRWGYHYSVGFSRFAVLGQRN